MTKEEYSGVLTPNIALKLPYQNDYYDVEVTNENSVIIDAEIKKLQDAGKTHENNKNNPHAVTKEQVGLANVSNYPITSSVNDASDEKYATAGAVKKVYDLANSGKTTADTKVSKAGDTMTGTLSLPSIELLTHNTPYIDFTNSKITTVDYHHRIISSGTTLQFLGASGYNNFSFNGNTTATEFIGPLQGNADSTTKLATARQINGTNFDGTANITTANWGTARNIQIGNTTKSVNGSGNVSWSLSEIGAVRATIAKLWSGSVNTGSIAISGITSYSLITIVVTSDSGLKYIPLTVNPNSIINQTIRLTIPSAQDIQFKITSSGISITSNYYNNSYIRWVDGIKL